VALVRTDVSEELSASFIRVTRIGEVGTTLEPHGVTSQKIPFFRKVYSLTNIVHYVQDLHKEKV
jgi:hypothetical protein